MFRKAQLAGRQGMSPKGRVAREEGEGMEGWVVRTRETIASVKKGRYCSCDILVKSCDLPCEIMGLY